MQNRRTVVISVAVAATAAVTAGGLIGLALSGGPVTSDPSPHSSATPQRAGATSAPAGSPSDSAKSGPGTTPGDPSGSDPSGTGSPGTGSPAARGGVETLPETPGATPSGLPGVTEPTRTPLPSWEGLPKEAVAARGRLVRGYPDRLLPVAPHATILTSSLSPATGQVQLALVARRQQSPAAVLRFYRARLVRAGFEERSVRTVGGASAAAFVREDNRVVITVDPGSAQTYSVQATLVTDQA